MIMDFILDNWVLIALFAFVFSIFASVKVVARFYQKAPPNKAMVVFGGGKQRIVVGGGQLINPFVNEIGWLDVSVFQLQGQVLEVTSKEKIPTNVTAVATLKIGSSDEMLNYAASRFLGKTPHEIQEIIRPIIQGALRGVVTELPLLQLIEDRSSFANRVADHVKPELAAMGIQVDSFLIEEITDSVGYIQALGLEEAARNKAKAAIGVADAERERATQVAIAEREQRIKVAEALREADMQASAARRDGETAKANAQAEIDVAAAKAKQTASDANRDLATRQAENDAIVQAKEARVPIIAEKAKTEEQKTLNQAVVEAQEFRIVAETKLQEKARELAEAKAQAEIIVPAQRKKDAMFIEAEAEAAANAKRAEGKKTATVIDANAEAEANVIKAQGAQKATIEKAKGDQEAKQLAASAERYALEQTADAARITAEQEATGRKAQAEATKAEMLAKADGELAQMTAQAQGREADLMAVANGTKAAQLAEAEGLRQKLLAEAEGVLKRAEALQALNQTGQVVEILKLLGPIIEQLGIAVNKAGEGLIAPIGQAIGQGLGNIKNLNLVEFGSTSHANGNGNGGSSLERFATTVPALVVKALNTADMTGLMSLLQQLLGDRLDLGKVMAGLAAAGMAARPTNDSVIETTPAPQATPPAPPAPTAAEEVLEAEPAAAVE